MRNKCVYFYVSRSNKKLQTNILKRKYKQRRVWKRFKYSLHIYYALKKTVQYLFLRMFYTQAIIKIHGDLHWTNEKKRQHFMCCVCYEITYQMTIIQWKWTLNALQCMWVCWQLLRVMRVDNCRQCTSKRMSNFDGLIHFGKADSKLHTKPIFIALKDCALHHFPIPNWQLFAQFDFYTI